MRSKAPSRSSGSAVIQAELWGERAEDWADVMEGPSGWGIPGSGALHDSGAVKCRKTLEYVPSEVDPCATKKLPDPTEAIDPFLPIVKGASASGAQSPLAVEYWE